MRPASAAKGYPFTGQVGGTPYTHPQYDPNAFYLYDLGVVVLDKPMAMGDYGALPKLDELDSLAGAAASRTSPLPRWGMACSRASRMPHRGRSIDEGAHGCPSPADPDQRAWLRR